MLDSIRVVDSRQLSLKPFVGVGLWQVPSCVSNDFSSFGDDDLLMAPDWSALQEIACHSRLRDFVNLIERLTGEISSPPRGIPARGDVILEDARSIINGAVWDKCVGRHLEVCEVECLCRLIAKSIVCICLFLEKKTKRRVWNSVDIYTSKGDIIHCSISRRLFVIPIRRSIINVSQPKSARLVYSFHYLSIIIFYTSPHQYQGRE